MKKLTPFLLLVPALSLNACAAPQAETPAPQAQVQLAQAKTETPAPSALASVTGLVETGEKTRFVRPAELARKAPTFTLKNAGKQTVKAQLSFAIKERSNASVPLQSAGEITLSPGQSYERKLTAAEIGPNLGIKYIDWQLKQNEQIASGHASFAIFDPVGVTPGVGRGFVFGNAGVRGYWDGALKEEVIRAMALVGVESFRGGSDWRQLEPERGKFNFGGEDATIDLAAKYGAQWQYLVSYGGAQWTKSSAMMARIRADKRERLQWRYPPTLEAWRAWNRALATHYKGRVRYYEIWNEPDLGFFQGTAPEYLELLKAASEEIKAVDPNAIVMTGGFGGMDLRDHKADVLNLTLEQGQPYFDRVAYHRHGTFARLQSEVDNTLLPLMKKYGVQEPLYFNETAMGKSYELEYEQAIELPKRLAFVWSRGATGYHYFNAWNREGEKSSARGYNMINPNFSPRPVYVAYNEMARALRGREFDAQLPIGDGRWAFSFRGRGDFMGSDADSRVVVAWNEDPTLADLPVVLNVGANAQARVVDLMGNSKPLEVGAGSVVWNIGQEPSYLILEDAPTLEPAGALLRAERAPALVPGGEVTLRATLRNPLATPQTARASWQVAAPLQARGPLTVERQLAPGESLDATLVVSAPTDLSADARSVNIGAEIVGTPLRAQSALAVPVAIKLGRADFGRAPDFDLARETDVVNTNDADPTTYYRVWGGPQDLSAQAWVARQGDDLVMRFRVRDDVASQPYQGKDLFLGDGVQVGLKVPGQNGDFEFGLGRDDKGRALVHSWSAPKGFEGGDVFRAIDLQTKREGDVMIYDVRARLDTFGLSAQKLKDGIGLSFVVNDLDEKAPAQREGFLRLSEGIAGAKDATRFPMVVAE